MKVFNKKAQNNVAEQPAQQAETPAMPEQKKSSENGHGFDKRTTIILIAIGVLLIGLVTGLILVRQTQTPQKSADVIGPSCPLDGFTCRWQTEVDVTYECIINELPAEGDPIEVARPTIQTDPVTGEALCTYTPEPNKRYSCTVNAVRFPGCESSDTADTICTAITLTPTMTPTPTELPTPTPTLHPQCYETSCDPEVVNDCQTQGLPDNHVCADTDPSEGENYRCILNEQCVGAEEGNEEACWCYAPTPTPTMTPTPTLTPTATSTPGPSDTPTPTTTPGASVTPTTTPPPGSTLTPTPSPTDIVVVNVTSTPVPTDTVIAQGEPTSTPAPTLPVAGIPHATYLVLLVGMLVVAIGLAL